jgi:hypothetical protein
LIHLLPFALFICLTVAVIRPQNYLDALTTDLRIQYNGATLTGGNPTGTLREASTPTAADSSIAFGGNRDMGHQVLTGPPSAGAQFDYRCFAESCYANTPNGYTAIWYYQLDGTTNTLTGTKASPSLGAAPTFSFSQTGETGLFVNVTTDHFITITFSVYSGAAPSNSNRYYYVLDYTPPGSGTFTQTFFIPYSTWSLQGSADFRQATAFAWVVEGDQAMDWQLNQFSPLLLGRDPSTVL